MSQVTFSRVVTQKLDWSGLRKEVEFGSSNGVVREEGVEEYLRSLWGQKVGRELNMFIAEEKI